MKAIKGRGFTNRRSTIGIWREGFAGLTVGSFVEFRVFGLRKVQGRTTTDTTCRAA